MPRFTTAYAGFIRRLDEVETLRRFAATFERRDPIARRHEINALCRGAIVLLSGHLEAFIKELGDVALESMHSRAVARTHLHSRLYYHISKDILEQVRVTGDPKDIADKIFEFLEADLPFWSRIGPFPTPVPIDRFNGGFANPTFNKIKSYFGRFGYSDYSYDLSLKLKAAYLPATNMVNHLVAVRNKIAHGDPGTTKTPLEIQQMTKIVRSFCSGTDSVFATWWRKNFCPIR